MRENAIKLYTSEQAKTLDRLALQIDQLKEGELMERAGQAAFVHVRFLWPRARNILIVCGPGNNGGDGYVVARKLLDSGLRATVCSVGNLERQPGDAQAAREAYQNAGGKVQEYQGGELDAGDLIVDALLGIGSERVLQGPFEEIVNAMNRNPAPVFALDLPTGIEANTGKQLGIAVDASATLSFIGIKRGSLTSEAVNHVGTLYLSSLGVSEPCKDEIDAEVFLLSEDVCRPLLPVRCRNTHKGEQGRLLLIGGAAGMTGAVQMAGLSALRAGAGLVRILSLDPVHASRVELMITELNRTSQLRQMLELADVIAIGPGLGRDARARQVLGEVLDFRKRHQPLVLDADALVCLSEETMKAPGAIVTPHPGEAAAMLSCSAAEIQYDRFSAAKEIAHQVEGVCVLKGAGTVISDGVKSYLSNLGGAELASAGTGDVLTGVVAAMAGQGLGSFNAARLGVYIHGLAGERAADMYGNGLLASDLIEQSPGCVQ